MKDIRNWLSVGKGKHTNQQKKNKTNKKIKTSNVINLCSSSDENNQVEKHKNKIAIRATGGLKRKNINQQKKNNKKRNGTIIIYYYILY